MAGGSIRKKLRRWALYVASAIALGVVVEFFIELAKERGLYEEPSSKVATVLSAIQLVTAQSWFPWLAGFAFGLCLGLWVDAALRRREQRDPALPASEIDREALAAEADQLAAKVAALIGEYEGRAAVAWEEDSNSVTLSRGEARTYKHAEVRARLMEKYGEKYHADVWRIIALARKCISLPYGDIWQISHGASDHDIKQIPRTLSTIAVSLRQPQPDIPLSMPWDGPNPTPNPAEGSGTRSP